jgi:prepilin-type N-terminal cleavage/methylation domain-containing protein
MTERRAQGGFTLVELMVSLVIFTFAIAGVLSVAVAMTRAYREQRRVIAMENAARAPLDFVVDALRQASPGVSSGTIKDANDCSFSGGAIQFVDRDTDPDDLIVVYGSGGVVSTTHSAFTSTSATIAIPSAHVGQFAIGDYVLVSNTSEGTLVRVTGVGAASLSVNVTCTTAFPVGGYPAGSLLVRAQRAKFTIETLDGIPTLTIHANGATAGEPVAEGVEDLQVAIGIDANNDDTLTDGGLGSTTDEWTGNASGDVLPAGAIRAVQVALVARDTKELSGVASFYEPADALNHSGSTTADHYRRRMLSSTVEIRNLSGSP